MKIAVFAGYYFPHVGGYITNIHELAKRLVLKGHEVTVITCNAEKADPEETRDGVKITRLPMLAHPGEVMPIPRPSKMLARVMRERYDVAITQSRIFATSGLGALYAAAKRVPLVHVERGGQHTVLSSGALSAATRLYDHIVGCIMLGTAKRTVGISEAAKQFISHLQPRTTPVVIYNGVDMPDNADKKRTCPAHYNIVFTGRLIHAKGVQDLINAVAEVRYKHDDVRLVVVGDGNYRRELQKQASNLLVKNRVVFTGEVNHDRITSVLGENDLFVNPSYSEGLPTSVTEAASMGMPIIATDVGGTGEIIKDGVSGMLTAPHDVVGLVSKINWMIEHKAEATTMGDKAKEAASVFKWDQIADQWEYILEDILGVH